MVKIMATQNQIFFYPRKKKHFKLKTPGLNGRPQRKGSCFKIFTRSPKKPNSAVRKVAKIECKDGTFLDSYIPGEGHSLQTGSVVLIRGGRVPDLPGIKYHLVRGVLDFSGLLHRVNSRSLYGTKKPQD